MFLEAEQSHEESVLNTGLKGEDRGRLGPPPAISSPTSVCSIFSPHHPSLGKSDGYCGFYQAGDQEHADVDQHMA